MSIQAVLDLITTITHALENVSVFSDKTPLHLRTGRADLLLEASLRAVELQEQGRGHGVGQRAEAVARVDHHVVQEL